MRKLRLAVKLTFIGSAVAAVGFFGYALWVSRDLPSPDAFANRKVSESTKIFDRSAKVLLYEIHGEERRTVVASNEIPEHMKQAIVVAEDERFFKHAGVDPAGIARSLLANLTRRSIAQGGSTITQQLIRNTIITKERTLARKIREVILALGLELRYSKEEILSFYLNTVPFGANAYGVEAAAQTYFGKSARDLTLQQAATFAVLPKAPTFYSPYGSRRDELLARKDYILTRMKDAGYITEEQYRESSGALPEFLPPARDIRAPHLVMMVKEYLEERFGKETVEQAGLTVVTTLDWDLQRDAENIVADFAAKNEKKWGARNAALVAMAAETGAVVALVGSRDYFDTKNDGNVNVAIRPRQPGSAFKPIVYAKAFERGYTPDTIVFDLPTEFAQPGAKSYMPQDYDGKTRGPVTLRQALANSLNIPAVKTLYLAGINETIDLAEALGITTLGDRERYGLSLVLGGGEVKLLELAAAYAALAQEGFYTPPVFISKIIDRHGNTVEEFHPQQLRVLDTNVARMVTGILSDNEARAMVFGTRAPLNVPGYAVAAKTGTTEDFRDGWTVGYSPALTVGVWTGNNDNSSMKKGADGVNTAAPLWQAFMKKALPRFPKSAFTQPAIPKRGKGILDGSYVIEERIKVDRISGKRATPQTPPELIEEKIFRSIHSLLFWVDKTDPLGPPPKNPENDPQFNAWEKTVQQWAADHGGLLLANSSDLPYEFDDVHKPEYAPRVTLQSPQTQKVIRAGQQLTVVFSASANFPLKNAVILLDERPLKTVSLKQRTEIVAQKVFVPIPALAQENEPQAPILNVRVFDQYGNGGTASQSLQYYY